MNRKLVVLLLAIAIVFPVSVFAMTTCRDTDAGCTFEQLAQLRTSAASYGLATAERIAILKEMIAKLNAEITQLQTSGGTNSNAEICLDLKNSLVIGSTDARTNGEVIKLQQVLGVSPSTGYYGSVTAQAVMKWQKEHGMDFVTLTSGVGPMTRAKLKEGCKPPTPAPVITSITPASAPVGATITVNGSGFLGFESDKYLWVTNSSGVKGLLYGKLDGSNTQVSATLPTRLCQIDVSYSGKDCPAYLELIPGVYTIYASGWGGKSNSVSFTITQ